MNFLKLAPRALDAQFPAARAQFRIPTRAQITRNPAIAHPDRPSVYLCGNSLGLQPATTASLLNEELQVWATSGVYGHFRHDHGRDWLSVDEVPTQMMARVVGARPTEVAIMATLTTNLHLLMLSFFRPTATRNKIMIEKQAFPSDHYMAESQLRMHGVSDGLVCIDVSSTDSILDAIDRHAQSVAVLLLPGVQYYSGQAFDIPTITAHAHKHGILVGWDLAHAAGNLLLHLHDWDVDFAAWCTYKYLNAGPGGIAGLFVHERHFSRPRLTGWWAHKKATRFVMDNVFDPSPGAAGFMLSNPSVLDMTALRASLEIFDKVGMPSLRERSVALTSYLEHLLDSISDPPFRIITPSHQDRRGAQLSLRFKEGMMDAVSEILQQNAVTADERRPDVIRVAPAPLYNTFQDVYDFVETLKVATATVQNRT